MPRIAICYEPPAEGIAADMQDTAAQVTFLQKYLKDKAFLLPYTGDVAAFVNTLKQADVAWNLFESFSGREEKQYLGAALLEVADMCYTGSPTEALLLCANKLTVRACLKEAGIDVPNGKFRPGTWIIKPARLHGSVGITDKSVVNATGVDDLNIPAGCFAEEYIDGDEYSVSLLDKGHGLTTVAVSRMDFIDYPNDRPKILGFDAKWSEESTDYLQTVRSFSVDAALAQELSKISEKAAAVLEIKGFARIDFRVDKNGRPFVIDVNPNPGLGEDAGFIAACRHADISVEDALKYIIEAAQAPQEG